MQELFQTGYYCWDFVNKSIPLYVPASTKEKYQSTGGWKDFTNIIEFGGERIEPLTEPQEVDVAVVPDQISLNGMVVGNTYYVLDADNGDGEPDLQNTGHDLLNPLVILQCPAVGNQRHHALTQADSNLLRETLRLQDNANGGERLCMITVTCNEPVDDYRNKVKEKDADGCRYAD